MAGESFEEITKEDLEDELGKFVEEVAGLCDLGDDYLSTCRALNYTKTRLQALLEMYKDCDGVGEKRGTYSGAYPFTFRQPIKHKIAFKSTILYPFIP